MGETPGPMPERHLVFVHGGGAGPWMWRAQEEHFGDRFTVHTPTLPGHRGEKRDAYRSHAHAAAVVAEELGLDGLPGTVTVVGFSVGGQIAIELAAAYPGVVTGTVVASALLSPWRGARALATVSSAAAPLARIRWFARWQARDLGIGAEDFEDYFAVSRSMTARSMRRLLYANFSFAVPPEFLRSRRPALLVAGSRERRPVLAGMERLRALRPGCELELIGGAGHDAPLSHPASFNRVLEGWLDRGEPVRGEP